MKQLGLALLVLALIAGCSTTRQAPVLAEGLEVLPSSTAVAWVTYADHLVKIHVTDEKRLQPTKDEVDAGEGMIPRQVTATVDEVFWSRPGTTEPSPTAVTWTSGGWIFHGKHEKEIQVDDTAWLKPGRDYLVPISYTSLSPGGEYAASWIPLGSKNTMPFDDNVIGRGDIITIDGAIYNGSNPHGETPMRDSVWGKGSQDVVATLDNTKPDPAAKDYMDLSPIDRYAAVVRAADKGDRPDSPGLGIPTITPTSQPS